MGDKAALAAMGISEAPPPPKVVETVPHFTSHAEEPHMGIICALPWQTSSGGSSETAHGRFGDDFCVVHLVMMAVIMSLTVVCD